MVYNKILKYMLVVRGRIMKKKVISKAFLAALVATGTIYSGSYAAAPTEEEFNDFKTTVTTALENVKTIEQNLTGQYDSLKAKVEAVENQAGSATIADGSITNGKLDNALQTKIQEGADAKQGLTELQTKVDENKTDLDQKIADDHKLIEQNRGKITTLEEKDAELEAKDTEIEGKVTAVEGKVGTLETSNGELTTKVGDLETFKLTTETKLGELETNINNVNTQATTNASDIQTVKGNITNLQNKDTELENKVTTLENKKVTDADIDDNTISGTKLTDSTISADKFDTATKATFDKIDTAAQDITNAIADVKLEKAAANTSAVAAKTSQDAAKRSEDAAADSATAAAQSATAAQTAVQGIQDNLTQIETNKNNIEQIVQNTEAWGNTVNQNITDLSNAFNKEAEKSFNKNIAQDQAIETLKSITDNQTESIKENQKDITYNKELIAQHGDRLNEVDDKLSSIVENTEAWGNTVSKNITDLSNALGTQIAQNKDKILEQNQSLEDIKFNVQNQTDAIKDLQVKNTEQDTRLADIETLNNAQNTRLDAIETKNTEQDGRLGNIEDLNKEQNDRLHALDGKTSDLTTGLGNTNKDLAGTKDDLSATKADMVKLDNRLSNRINDVEKGANSGIASALATANIAPLPGDNTSHGLGIGIGKYRNGTAIAVGLTGVNEKRTLSWKLATTYDSDNAFGLGMGVNIAFGKHTPKQTVNNDELKAELEFMRSYIGQLHDEIEALKAQIATK